VTEVLDKFTKNLQKQAELYQAVVELERAKQSALTDNNIKELEIITAKEEGILFQISKLEAERMHWAHFFSETLGKSADEITMADMIQCYPQLNDIRQALELVLTELRNLHEINTKMLKSAIDIINFTMQALTTERKTTYTNPKTNGNKEKTPTGHSSLIDKSI
jgi:hypothetical protein